MARIRSIKPDAFTSDSLSTVSRGARWTFAGLWTYVDDEGRGRADVRLIRAALYPLDEATTSSDVATDLDVLEAIGAVCRYQVDGKEYLHIPKWTDHQSSAYRRTDSKLPPPASCACKNFQASSSKKLLEVEVEVEVEVEQGSGSGSAQTRASTPADLPPVFLEFIDAYPGNVATKPAFAAWIAAVKRTKGHPEHIIEGAYAYAKWVAESGTESKFVRNAAKWLADDGWADKLAAVGRASPKKSTTDERVGDAFALAQELRNEQERQATTPKAIGQ